MAKYWGKQALGVSQKRVKSKRRRRKKERKKEGKKEEEQWIGKQLDQPQLGSNLDVSQ